MGLFNKKNGGIMNVIRCDEPSYLIWKWHPEGVAPGQSMRENAIRFGSSLRVKDGEVAVFVYNRDGGIMQDYIEGPYDGKIDTDNLPILSSVIGAFYGGNSPFQAEIYFINWAELIQIKFGVPFFDVFDPRFLDYGVPVAVRGTINFRIGNYVEFIRLHQLRTFDMDSFQRQIQSAVVKFVKRVVANAPVQYSFPVVQIERQIEPISESIQEALKEKMQADFGIEISRVDISDIEIDKTSTGYQQLKTVTQDVSTAKIQVQTGVDIQKMKDTQRIEAINLEAMLKAQREETQYAQHIQTQSQHLKTHQLNQQTAVGLAGADALGKMGSGGGIDTSGGINPSAMISGMAMGGAIGQNLAGILSGMVGGLNQPIGGMTPPPVPTISFYTAENGQSAGPYDIAALSQMALVGKLSQDSLVWRPGMETWAQAGSVLELQKLFDKSTTPPEIPPIS